ncbi:hypothetical protein PC39_03542 [Salinisphaera sp. PC39]
MKLKLKVVPGARRDEIAGWLGDALKVRVSAPPEKGKANAAVIALLAARLGVPERDVHLVSGAGAPRKTVEIDGVTPDDLRRIL